MDHMVTHGTQPTLPNKMKSLSASDPRPLNSLSHTEQQSHSCQHPLGRPFPGFEAESPYICGSSDLGLVERTLVDIPGLLAVIGHSSD